MLAFQKREKVKPVELYEPRNTSKTRRSRWVDYTFVWSVSVFVFESIPNPGKSLGIGSDDASGEYPRALTRKENVRDGYQ